MDHPNISRVFDRRRPTESGYGRYFVDGAGEGHFRSSTSATSASSRPATGWNCSSRSARPSSTLAQREGNHLSRPQALNIPVAPHDGVPVVKVIDFGVAKAIGQQLTDKTIYTRFLADDRDAAVHEPGAGRDRMPSMWTSAATSTAWACCCTSCLTGTTPFDRQPAIGDGPLR